MAGCFFRKDRSNKMELVQLVKDVPQRPQLVKDVPQRPTAVYYPKSLHLQSAFAYLGYKEGDMPISEDCSKRIFSLPMHPYLEDREIERICRIIGNEISLAEHKGK
jgi:dTDP-4-amino-4,6-dideoxygalactose transaminase